MRQRLAPRAASRRVFGAFAPRVWHSGLRHCMPAGSAALQWYVNRAPLVGDRRSAALQIAHAGSRARVTSMGGLYDAATLRAPQSPCSLLLLKWAARWRCQRAANAKDREGKGARQRERERERDQAAKLARAQGRVSDMADDCQQTHKRAGRQRACSTITAVAARRREAVVRQPAGGRKPLK